MRNTEPASRRPDSMNPNASIRLSSMGFAHSSTRESNTSLPDEGIYDSSYRRLH